MKREPATVELLAPAGNFEKLRLAVDYGADAVYLGDRHFSLRSAADNFTLEEMDRAVAYAHSRNVRVYVACNIYPRTAEEERIVRYLTDLGRIRPDAVIVADPGICLMIRETLPDMPIHLSTQANTTSLKAVRFWETQGVSRINIARELSLEEIKVITAGCDLEIEAFVHGAVCVAYSGRCLLSNFLTGRDGNRGKCSHPCRWQYHLSEELRPGQFLPIEETGRGSFIFNTRDLCMIDHVDKMIAAGIASLKIEGRMKGCHYLAATIQTYREAIDACRRAPGTYQAQDRWRRTLAAVTSRGYSTHFYFDDPGSAGFNYAGTGPEPTYTLVALVLDRVGPGRCRGRIKNKLFCRDRVEILSPGRPARKDIILEITGADGRPLAFAQPNSEVTLSLNGNCYSDDLIRRIEKD